MFSNGGGSTWPRLSPSLLQLHVLNLSRGAVSPRPTQPGSEPATAPRLSAAVLTPGARTAAPSCWTLGLWQSLSHGKEQGMDFQVLGSVKTNPALSAHHECTRICAFPDTSLLVSCLVQCREGWGRGWHRHQLPSLRPGFGQGGAGCLVLGAGHGAWRLQCSGDSTGAGGAAPILLLKSGVFNEAVKFISIIINYLY